MQAEKERIIQVIETMPEDKLLATIEAVDDINLNYDPDLDDVPDDLLIKDKEDFYRFVQRGLDDVKAGRIYTLEEADKITQNH